MLIRQSGDVWFWITFKYENVPTFYFICEMIGHSDKFCSKLFVTPENEIVSLYEVWMRAPSKTNSNQLVLNGFHMTMKEIPEALE